MDTAHSDYTACHRFHTDIEAHGVFDGLRVKLDEDEINELWCGQRVLNKKKSEKESTVFSPGKM